jgi:hypothetical protein
VDHHLFTAHPVRTYQASRSLGRHFP